MGRGEGGSSRNFPRSQLPDWIQWGGGGVAEIFPVNKSLTFPRFRDIFLAFSGHLRIIRRLWTLPENSGTLHMSAYTFKPRNNINSFRKTTFTKSLGGPWSGTTQGPFRHSRVRLLDGQIVAPIRRRPSRQVATYVTIPSLGR